MGKEFTGDYYECMECDHIWDYNDICPECGDQYPVDINESDVIERAELLEYKAEKLREMVKLHN